MSSSVRVRITVEILTGSWGDDCSLGQARKQAEQDARGRLRKLFEGDHSCKIIGDVRTEIVLIGSDKGEST